MRFTFTLLAFFLTSLTFHTYAAEVEISSYIGYTFSPSLAPPDNTSKVSVDDNVNFSLGFAWQEKSTQKTRSQGQGQILINYIGRDFTHKNTTNNQQNNNYHFDTLYVHFNGVNLIQESSYTTAISLGFGATYFDSDFNDVIYPSLSTSIGTRHEISSELTFITEVRAYATLVKDDEPLFCQQGDCVAYFDSAIWFDTNISIGLAYSF